MVLLGLGLITTFSLKRNHALVPFIALLCIIPFSHRISLLTLDFPIHRIMLIALVARAIIRGELPIGPFGLPEKLIFSFIFSFNLISGVSSGQWVTVLGQGVTLILLAFVVRVYLNKQQFIALTTVAGLIALPTAAAFWHEHTTLNNIYRIFGGVSDITPVRNGEVRAKGPFLHPIYAGLFWITFSCFFIWRGIVARKVTQKAFWGLTVVSCLVIGFATSSSTPILAFAAILMCWGAYLFRAFSHLFLPGLILTIIALDLVMKAPVWHLISRVGTAKGSTSYFRFSLIDAFFANIGEWFIAGTRSTAHWFWGAQDLANQFVYYGVRGGAISLILFIAMTLVILRHLSKLFNTYEKRNSPERWLVWSFMASICSTMIAFIGVSYFDQIAIQLYLVIFGGVALVRSEDAIERTKHDARRPKSDHATQPGL